MITGTYSIINQAIAMNNFPPIKVIHTSHAFQGQIYIPLVNWLLMIGTSKRHSFTLQCVRQRMLGLNLFVFISYRDSRLREYHVAR